MAALDFPDTPTVGQLYGSSGTVWRWDGARWASTAGASGARGAVAYAQATATQTGFSSIVDIAGLTVTWNAQAGRRYKITGSIMCQTNVAGDSGQLSISTGAGASVSFRHTAMPLSANNYGIHIEWVSGPALEGPATYKLRYQRAAGTGTHAVYSDPQAPSFILVEDITYEGGSTNPGGGVPPPPIVTVCADVNAFAWNSTNPGTVAALNTVVTPRSNGSKFHLRASLQVSGIGADDTWYYLMRGALGIGMSTGATGGTYGGNASAYHRFDPARNGLEVAHVTMEYVDSPNTTSPITYSCAMNVRVATTQAVYLNRRANDLTIGGISSLVVQEILP